ncbi:hypothetical protein FIE12Z_5736 [Fusarium flagelliforme]|uniref:Uncharacterized protein n=2 Tax=Fusarium flagelliforme TaxID=2675880 RepID=A0A395MPX6_9HYPO|nr:hypothetical protein FIE12Z_5736 [Fusarium flagelliforme]
MAPYMFEDPFQAGINPYMGAGFDGSPLGSISLPYGNTHYVPNGINYVADGLPYDVPMGVSQPWGVANFIPAGVAYGVPTRTNQFPNAVNYVSNVGNNVLPGCLQESVWAQNSEPAQPAGFDGTARPSAQLCQDANGDGGVDTVIKNREACLPEEALKAAATIREKYPQVPKEVYASFLIPPPKGDRVARNEYADRMREYKIPHGLIIKLGQMDCAEATLRGGLRNKRLPAKQRPRSSDDIWNDQYVGALLWAVSEVQKRMGIPSYSIHGIVWEEVADEMHKLMGPKSFKFSSIAVSRRYKCQDPFEGDVEKKNKKKIIKKKN